MSSKNEPKGTTSEPKGTKRQSVPGTPFESQSKIILEISKKLRKYVGGINKNPKKLSPWTRQAAHGVAAGARTALGS